MMKRLFGLILIIISSYVLSCQKPPAAGRIEYLVDLFSGSVSVSRDSGSSWKPVQVGMKLSEGDRLKTGTDSFCDVLMPDRGVFRLSSVSELALDQLKKQIEKIRVARGRILANVTTPLSPDEDFLVETSTAVVSVRGTEFMVDTDGDKTVTSVKKGRVAVRKNIAADTAGVLDAETVGRLLEVPVGENEDLEVDAEDNRRLEERISRKLKGVKDRKDAEKILAGEKTESLRKVRKIRNIRELEDRFRDLSHPDKIRRIREEGERLRRDRRDQERRLEENLKKVKEKAGLKDIAGKKVGESPTTAEEDIRSGAVDRKVKEIRRKMKERSGRGTNDTGDGAEPDKKPSRLDKLRDRTRKALDRDK